MKPPSASWASTPRWNDRNFGSDDVGQVALLLSAGGLFGSLTQAGGALSNCWQDEPAAVAMEKSIDLIKAYVAAGFSKIHLDVAAKNNALSRETDGTRDVVDEVAEIGRLHAGVATKPELLAR
jgi:hypothetical protein